MRNKRFFIVLGGALLFGLLAAVSVSRYLSSAQAYTKNLNGVVVAKVAIPIGTKIIPEQVTVVQFPAESTPDGAFQSVDKLAGRVAVVNIAAREPITEPRLAPEGTAGGLSAVIPEGYRAMNEALDQLSRSLDLLPPGIHPHTRRDFLTIACRNCQHFKREGAGHPTPGSEGIRAVRRGRPAPYPYFASAAPASDPTGHADEAPAARAIRLRPLARTNRDASRVGAPR